MASSIANSWYTNLEQVAPTLARYYDHSTSLAGRLKPSKTVAASRYLYRQPFMQWVGGTYKKYIANAGVLGSGTGPLMNALEAGYFDSTFAFSITKEQMDYKMSNGSAMADVLTEILSGAFQEIDVYDNINLFNDGTGKLTNAASTGTSTTLTFAASTDTKGVNQVRVGTMVDVWDSTGATLRAGGPYLISNIDVASKTVTFSAAPTGMGTTDLIAVADLDVYGPSTLTSFSSTWPGGGLSNAPGLTGDSWRHGLPYANDATGANYYLGKLKSSYYQLVPATIAAAGAALTFSMIETAKNLAIQQRDETILDGMECVVHMAQRQQLQDTLTAVSNFYRDAGNKSAEMIDLIPRGANMFTAASLNFIVDKRQDKARVDAFNSKNWFRVEGHPTEWYDYGEGRKVWNTVDSTTGDPKAEWQMQIVQKMDTGCMDPGASFYISGLAVPTNY